MAIYAYQTNYAADAITALNITRANDIQGIELKG